VRARFADHHDVVLTVGEKEWMTAATRSNLTARRLAHAEAGPDEPLRHLLEAFMEYLRTAWSPIRTSRRWSLIAGSRPASAPSSWREVTIQEVLE